MQKTLFLADMHLRPGHEPEQNRRLASLLQHNHGARRIILLGDIFNCWYERDRSIVGDYHEVLDLFATAAQRGVEIYHIAGNRDFAIDRGRHGYWPGFHRHFSPAPLSVMTDYGIEPVGESLHLELDGQRLHCTHGDNLCNKDHGHMILRWWLMGWAGRIGSTWFPFSLTERIVSFVQKRKVTPHFGVLPYAETITDHAVAPLIESGADWVICGHIHWGGLRDVVSRTRRGRLLIVPSWGAYDISMIFEHGRPFLLRPQLDNGTPFA